MGRRIFKSHHTGHSSLCYPRSAVALGNTLIWCSAKKARETCLGLVKGQVGAFLPTLFVSLIPSRELTTGGLESALRWMGCHSSKGITCQCGGGGGARRCSPRSQELYQPAVRVPTVSLFKDGDLWTKWVLVKTLSCRQN